MQFKKSGGILSWGRFAADGNFGDTNFGDTIPN